MEGIDNMNDNNINKIYDWHAMPIDEIKTLKNKKNGSFI